jgi:type IV secretory pathway VirB6-like protein
VIKRYVALLILLVISQIAFCSDAIAAASAITISDASGLSAKVTSLLTSVQNAMTNAGARLVGAGMWMLGSFLTITFAWNGMRWALGGDKTIIIGDFMEIILKATVGYWILKNYGSMGAEISGGFDTIISLFGGTQTGEAIKTLFQIAASTMTGVYEAIKISTDTVSWSIPSIITFLVFLVLMGVVTFIVLRGMITAALFILAAGIFFNVIWMLAPIFVPFVLGWIFAPLFQNWLNLLVMSGLYKVVAIAMIVATNAILASSGIGAMNGAETVQATFFTKTEGGELAINLFSVLVVIFFALALEFMIKQVPSIASGLAGIRGIDIGAMAAGGAMNAGANKAAGMAQKAAGAGKEAGQAAGQGGTKDQAAAMRQRMGTLYSQGTSSGGGAKYTKAGSP